VTVAADFTNGSLTLPQASARLSAQRLVLSLPATISLYRQYHAELDFSANDDMSHRREIGEHFYCRDQVYVQATYEASHEEHMRDMLFSWIVNIRLNKVVGPKGISMPDGLKRADLTEGGKCIDGGAPIPLPR
jgi:hypothetical protein